MGCSASSRANSVENIKQELANNKCTASANSKTTASTHHANGNVNVGKSNMGAITSKRTENDSRNETKSSHSDKQRGHEISEQVRNEVQNKKVEENDGHRSTNDKSQNGMQDVKDNSDVNATHHQTDSDRDEETIDSDDRIIKQQVPGKINKAEPEEMPENYAGSEKTSEEETCSSEVGDSVSVNKSQPVIASYVGSGDNQYENNHRTDSDAVKAYASYVGSDQEKGEIRENDDLKSVIKTAESDGQEYTEEREKENGDDLAKKQCSVSEDKTSESTEVAVDVEYPDDDMSGPAPTLVKAKDIMPSADVLQVLAEQVKRNPIALKPSLGSLVKRLTKPAKTDLEKVWTFYRWIVINIKYDVDGYFGDAPTQPTDPASVLKTGKTVCEGYTNLIRTFCEKANIEARVISGYAKPYGYTIGDDVSKSDSCKHLWNSVLIDGKWFLMDCTWGAGFVKPKDKKYIRWPNDFYFFTDPEIFISDHFPMMDNDYDTSCKWQLLEMPITLETFIKRVNMDQPGKEWGILTHHHPYATIDVQNEAEIMIEESHTPMLNYTVHMRNNDFHLMDQFTFAYKLNAKTFKVHVRPPTEGEYMCQIFGRREVDGLDAHPQPLVLYKLNCTEVYDCPREFPQHNAIYGPVSDIGTFGFCHTGNVFYKAEFGEITILLNPTRDVSFVPHLYIGDTEFDYLRENCIVQYSEDFRHVTVSLRLPFEGFFRLTLYGKKSQHNETDSADDLSSKSTDTSVYNVKFRRPKSNTGKKATADELKPFVSYLIDNRQASDKDPFPFAHTAALKYKCCLLQPSDKEVKTEREINVCLRSLFLERVKAGDDLIPKVDDSTFAGKTVTTKADAKFIIYGSESKEGNDFVPLYECFTSK